MRLAGKIAIITGGASGIGHEAAKLFAANGAVVMVADRDLDGATRVVQEIKAQGGKASAYKVDVAQEAEVKAMIEAAVAAHGRLDILVNNAGYGIAGTVVNDVGGRLGRADGGEREGRVLRLQVCDSR